ncbi:5-histidylcysteine sulfoxide synthase [Thiomicrorhabdus sp. zzn3]|uniref:5-histidylcysteine sulfoxide synthase n=1 Tax=Thiomicrorhabdus sp. zzn3 TaxID=3039775 RepID=UPI00243697B5|nr:5-histidylcysteine sulfoxide synthase [Thiomicrorhabdus sp. zzn3]MDG6778675.1 5-histidylcysteine sulfoxide synthase [Thiomicrorhabdus sp. zzn3]
MQDHATDVASTPTSLPPHASEASKRLSRDDLITQSPILNDGDVETKRAEIKRYFNLTYDAYEALFDTLKTDSAFYERPCSLRHPLIFYFGHTATFFTNKLVLAKLLPKRINPKIESLCAIGVDEMSWDDLNDAHYDWPSVDEVRIYRRHVRAAVNDLIDSMKFTLPIDWNSPIWPVMMGIEHERIHLETSSVLIRQLPLSSVQPHPLFPICPHSGKAPENRLIDVPAGAVDINHQDPAETYGWDNEYGEHHAEIASFKAAQYLVSNKEYLAFVEAGGYQTDAFWSEEGNRWREFTPDKHPTFWVQKTDLNGEPEWWLRCMTQEIPMPWNWPVEVNFLEAEAFCKWKAKLSGQAIRLPSEDEYLRLRDHTHALALQDQANINLQEYASSTPVDQHPHGDFFDVVGNVWQWTQTPIYPFDGFKVHPLYDDFTMPTFDNKHNIFKGGCWISTGNEINGHSRYAFRRHFFQHAGFRYIESAAPVQTEFSTYETDEAAAQYCEFHYGERYFDVDNFPQAYANLAIEQMHSDPTFSGRSDLKALEIGCSVGRGCFELARHFAAVTGLDFSARFIQIAERMKQQGSIRYTIPQEGEIMAFKAQSLDKLGLGTVAEKCQFMQQDATNLKPHFTGYDLIIAANVIDRLYDPGKFLGMIHERLNQGGLLILTSPNSWDSAFTEPSRWLGGYKDAHSGENVTTLEGLHALLDAEFESVGQPMDLPFVIRETARKFQHSVAEVTVWKKRG